MNQRLELDLRARVDPSPLARLAQAPTRLSRAGRRTRRTALLLADAAVHIERELAALPDDARTNLRRQNYAAFVAENVCAINGFDVQVSGTPPRGPAILVCNHISWQDPFLIAGVVPTLAVAKREVSSWPLIGELARGLDYMFVDRGRAHSGARVLLRAKTLLERGACVLTFPEGTTTCGGEVLPLRRGMFGLSQITGVPVWPIALTYVDADAPWVGDESFFPSFYRTVARPRTRSYLDFGAPIDPREHAISDEMAARARAVITEMLQARAASLLHTSELRT